jgi:hypothetical protein
MTISIPRTIISEIHSHAEATYPEECCGLLIGGGEKATLPSAKKMIVESIRMKNAYDGPKHDRYNIDPLELFKADRAISQSGRTVAGITTPIPITRRLSQNSTWNTHFPGIPTWSSPSRRGGPAIRNLGFPGKTMHPSLRNP